MNDPGINILIVTVRADFGGGPEHIYRLIKSINGRVNFFIACPHDYPYYNLYKEAVGTSNIIEIPHRKFSFTYLFKLYSFARSNGINIIHSHGKGAGIYGRLLSLLTNKKCIHTFHGIHIGNYSSFQKALYLWVERFLSLFTDEFISVSESEAGTVRKLKITQPGKINIIHNGTDIPPEISSFGFNNDIFNIVTITRFDYAKNSLLLIPICRELQKIKDSVNFRLVILGSGEEEAEFKRIISSENIENLFELKGFVNNTGEFLKGSFCYISTSRWEGLPLGILEALSYGIPVIATNVNGNRDIIEHNKNGFLFDIAHPAEAAEYIMKLAGDKELHKYLSQNGRNIIREKYSLSDMADKTYNLYRTVNLRI